MSKKMVPISKVTDADRGRTVTQSIEVDGVPLVRGQQFKIKGSHEKFTFRKFVVNDRYEWIEAAAKNTATRCFTVDRISKVLPLKKPKV